MKSRPAQYLIMVSAACWLILFQINLAVAEEQTSAPLLMCPSHEEMVAELADRAEVLQRIKLELEDLAAGRKMSEKAIEALLLVDLENEQAVRSRRQELRESTRLAPPAATPGLDKVIRCALQDKQLKDSASGFLNLRRKVDLLRLGLLDNLEQLKEFVQVQDQVQKARNPLAKTLEAARNNAIKDLARAEIQLKVAEHFAFTLSSGDLKDLAAARTLLEKTKIDLLQRQLEWLNEIGNREAFYKDAVVQVLDIKGQAISETFHASIKDLFEEGKSSSFKTKDLDSLKKDYDDSVKLWRALVDRAYRTSFKAIYQLKLPDLPRYPKELTAGLGDVPQVVAYRESFDDAVRIRNSFARLNTEIFQLESESLYRLLIVTGQLRSNLLNDLINQGDSSHIAITGRYFQDLTRELEIVPYRWTAIATIKILDIRQNLRKGIEGIFSLGKDFLKLIVFLSLFVLFWLSIKKLMSILNHLRFSLLKGPSPTLAIRQLAVLIQRILPYLPWLVIIPAVEVGEQLIARSVFSELGIFLPYIQIYSVYRILMLLVTDVLSAISSQVQTTKLQALQTKVKRSARILGLFFLVSWSILYAVESIVSQALVYRVASRFFTIAGLIVIALVGNRWSEELAEFIEESSANPVAMGVSRGSRGRFSFFWSIPALMAATGILCLRLLERWGESSDAYKRLSARIFRHKLEIKSSRQEVDLNDLENEYACWFSPEGCEDASVLVVPKNDLLLPIEKTIFAWQAGSMEEHSIAICGAKGSGKSWLLNRLQSQTQDMRVLRTNVPPKLLGRDAVLSLFEQLLDISLGNGVDSLLEADRQMPKTLILIDDAENLFLAKLGGFEGYKMLVDLVSAETRNIFWCAAFKNFSWSYLDRVFGTKRCFDLTMPVPQWSDADIKELIYARHNKTGYSLAYDGIVNAAGTGNRLDTLAHAESNFFRLLWQQSDGNPSAALYFWMSSLIPKGRRLLRVGLPEDPGVGRVSGLLEDELFVYTEIIRHGNLTAAELAQVTNLPERFVSKVLKLGVENKVLVHSSDSRYDVNVSYQGTLSFFLADKNFIYGS